MDIENKDNLIGIIELRNYGWNRKSNHKLFTKMKGKNKLYV